MVEHTAKVATAKDNKHDKYKNEHGYLKTKEIRCGREQYHVCKDQKNLHAPLTGRDEAVGHGLPRLDRNLNDPIERQPRQDYRDPKRKKAGTGADDRPHHPVSESSPCHPRYVHEKDKHDAPKNLVYTLKRH